MQFRYRTVPVPSSINMWISTNFATPPASGARETTPLRCLRPPVIFLAFLPPIAQTSVMMTRESKLSASVTFRPSETPGNSDAPQHHPFASFNLSMGNPLRATVMSRVDHPLRSGCAIVHKTSVEDVT
ncbi:hypothetical protein BP00DRAFT_423715 [Aspergillus indologenus CBS 114.80]|uniref:Uncharacterized protein n=1 Tax=Aspergillus indologenus CBS 114.80 TaxID=1450541 RepID=A0A2V5IY79_9EURO|nr:hypothetical protein BP00DRAFT_423715 [Aspergillus indologenus CBS 114.80]